jgi:hypothetical protein
MAGGLWKGLVVLGGVWAWGVDVGGWCWEIAGLSKRWGAAGWERLRLRWGAVSGGTVGTAGEWGWRLGCSPGW